MTTDDLIAECHTLAAYAADDHHIPSEVLHKTLLHAATLLGQMQQAYRTQEFSFARGDRVIKAAGDYTFIGYVAMPYFKLDNKTIRYIVEDDRGLNLIVNGKQIMRTSK